MKIIALFNLSYGGRFVPEGDEFECSGPDGEALIKRGFKPANKPKKAKPTTGGGGK